MQREARALCPSLELWQQLQNWPVMSLSAEPAEQIYLKYVLKFKINLQLTFSRISHLFLLFSQRAGALDFSPL